MKDRIKKIRKELDLTQQAFADKLGIKRNTVATYENGRNMPIDAVVSLICKVFNVNKDWLLTGSGDMFLKIPSDTLEKLKQEYNLDDFSYRLICEYLELDETKRDIVKQFFYNVTSTEESPKDMDIDSMVEDYRRQLILEKKAAEKSGVSQKNG